MDGEVESSKNIVIKVVPRALKFVVPRKLSWQFLINSLIYYGNNLYGYK
jgi:hypothetical protein